MNGIVEVDESYVGGEETGVVGRQTIKKAIVAIAIEVRDRGFGRVRLRHVPDVSEPSLVGFVSDMVEPGSTVHTDGWPSYSSLGSRGYDHTVTVLSASPDPAHVLMPGVHRVASLLKRWLLGTLQGGVSNEHLLSWGALFENIIRPRGPAGPHGSGLEKLLLFSGSC